jgi:hypothetical protein
METKGAKSFSKPFIYRFLNRSPEWIPCKSIPCTFLKCHLTQLYHKIQLSFSKLAIISGCTSLISKHFTKKQTLNYFKIPNSRILSQFFLR